jgi:hypothetical protein
MPVTVRILPLLIALNGKEKGERTGEYQAVIKYHEDTSQNNAATITRQKGIVQYRTQYERNKEDI